MKVPRIIHEVDSNRTVDGGEFRLPPGVGWARLPWRKLLDALRAAGEFRIGSRASHVLVDEKGVTVRLEPIGQPSPKMVRHDDAPADEERDAEGLRDG